MIKVKGKKEKIVSICNMDDVLHVVTADGKVLYEELKCKKMFDSVILSPTGKWIELEVIQK